jgi:predicted RNase H-like nuclease
MKFLGIDLGWQSQPSGLCCLVWQDGTLQLLALERLELLSDILDWIDGCVGSQESAVIAVDAPTLIPNATGMRLPDRLTHQYFGRYHAGCYPANLNLPFAQRTVGFGLSLEARGFIHAPEIQPQQPGRYQIEVFPHPATIHLFGLKRILKYKKGKLVERQAELVKLRDHVLTVLPTLEPALRFATKARFSFPLEVPQTGQVLKTLEDKLDSLICAYVAAYWWYWGLERNWVLGAATPEESCVTGYIIVPAPLTKSTPRGTADLDQKSPQ